MKTNLGTCKGCAFFDRCLVELETNVKKIENKCPCLSCFLLVTCEGYNRLTCSKRRDYYCEIMKNKDW